MPGADLLSGDSELTELGKTFFDSYKDLQRCADDSLDSAMKGTPSPSSTVPFAEIAGEISFCCFIPIFITPCVHRCTYDSVTNGPRSKTFLFFTTVAVVAAVAAVAVTGCEGLNKGLPCGAV